MQPRCQIVITHMPDGSLGLQCTTQDQIYLLGLLELAKKAFLDQADLKKQGMGVSPSDGQATRIAVPRPEQVSQLIADRNDKE